MSSSPPSRFVIPSVLAASVVLMLVLALSSRNGRGPARKSDDPAAGAPAFDERVRRLNREANRLSALGRHDDALAILDRVLVNHPDSAPTHYNRGRIFHVRGDPETALREYNRAIDIRPDYAKALTNRALILAGCGEVDSAIADLSRAIDAAPDRTAAYYHRGRLRLRLGRPHEARADFDRLLELDPGDRKARKLRAEAYEELRLRGGTK